MNSKLIFFYLHGMWRRKWIAASVCWAVCIAGWSGIFGLEDIWQSDARVYVDISSLLTPLLRGLAAESNPLQQLDFMQRTLLSRPNLEQVIHLADLDTQAKTPEQKETLLKQLAHDVRIGLQGNNLFTISYQESNPVEAKNIVQAVLTVFSETSAGNSRSEMDSARRFLEEQIANYEKQLRAAEARRAQFRAQYGDVMPQEQQTRARLDQLRADLARLQLSLQDGQARRDSISKEVAGVPQMLSIDQAAAVIINNGNGSSGNVQLQLADARRRLIDLQSRYTDDHPDVLSVKRDIAGLEKQLNDQATGKVKDAPDATRRSTVSNPVYEQLKLRLADAESTVASIQRQIGATQQEQQRLDQSLSAAPGIELQAQNLDRDYGILKKNYDELVQRREAANLAQAADTQTDKVQFRIVDAPQVPLKPIGPNRPVLYSAVLFAGMGAGIAAVFLLIQLDRSYSSVGGLRGLGLPVLGTISRVMLVDARRRQVRDIGGLVASTFALLLIYGALLVANSTSFRGMI